MTAKRIITQNRRAFVYSLISILLLAAGLFIYFIPPARFLSVVLLFFGIYSGIMALLCVLMNRGGINRSAAEKSGPVHSRSAKIAKILYKIMQICFIIWLLSFIIIESFVIAGGRADSENEDADYLIVLGAGLNGSSPSLSLRSRLVAAADYLRTNPGTVAIVTGGQGEGEDITEAEAMRRFLEAEGIAENRIIMEPEARDTIQNLRYSFEIILQEGHDSGAIYSSAEQYSPKITLISNDFHLFRARYISEREGHEIFAVPALSPNIFLYGTYCLREYFSMLKVFLTYR